MQWMIRVNEGLHTDKKAAYWDRPLREPIRRSRQIIQNCRKEDSLLLFFLLVLLHFVYYFCHQQSSTPVYLSKYLKF